MSNFLLMFLYLLVTAWATFTTFYLWRFIRIIWILEDDFSQATEVLQKAEETLEACLHMPMFFDSPEVQRAVVESLDEIRAAKVSVGGLIHIFTQRSKQKYVQVIEVAGDKG